MEGGEASSLFGPLLLPDFLESPPPKIENLGGNIAGGGRGGLPAGIGPGGTLLQIHRREIGELQSPRARDGIAEQCGAARERERVQIGRAFWIRGRSKRRRWRARESESVPVILVGPERNDDLGDGTWRRWTDGVRIGGEIRRHVYHVRVANVDVVMYLPCLNSMIYLRLVCEFGY